MLYIKGTIDRDDGKRMTQKRANDLFDAFLDWLEQTQDCLFGGSFNPAYKDGDHVVTANTTGGPLIDLVESVKWATVRKRKAKPRKAKRKKKR